MTLLRFVAAAGLFASALSCRGGAAPSGGLGGDGMMMVGGRGGGGIAGETSGGSGPGGRSSTTGGAGGSSTTGEGGAVPSGPGGNPMGGNGGAGAGGAGGRQLLACTDSGTDAGGGSIRDAGGTLLAESLTAAVTVASIDGCAMAPCPPVAPPEGQREIVLASADQRQWTLTIALTAMPPDLIQIGDAFDLKVDAGTDPIFYPTVNQTVVLVRSGKLILFASSTERFYGLAPPNLAAFGIGIDDGEALCGGGSTPGQSCIPIVHSLVVTVDGRVATVVPHHATTIGWLSFTAGSTTVLMDTGFCDSKTRTTMAGFRVP